MENFATTAEKLKALASDLCDQTKQPSQASEDEVAKLLSMLAQNRTSMEMMAGRLKTLFEEKERAVAHSKHLTQQLDDARRGLNTTATSSTPDHDPDTRYVEMEEQYSKIISQQETHNRRLEQNLKQAKTTIQKLEERVCELEAGGGGGGAKNRTKSPSSRRSHSSTFYSSTLNALAQNVKEYEASKDEPVQQQQYEQQKQQHLQQQQQQQKQQEQHQQHQHQHQQQQQQYQQQQQKQQEQHQQQQQEQQYQQMHQNHPSAAFSLRSGSSAGSTARDERSTSGRSSVPPSSNAPRADSVGHHHHHQPAQPTMRAASLRNPLAEAAPDSPDNTFNYNSFVPPPPAQRTQRIDRSALCSPTPAQTPMQQFASSGRCSYAMQQQQQPPPQQPSVGPTTTTAATPAERQQPGVTEHRKEALSYLDTFMQELKKVTGEEVARIDPVNSQPDAASDGVFTGRSRSNSTAFSRRGSGSYRSASSIPNHLVA